MKTIKLCSALLLLLAVTVGCEKESIESPEEQPQAQEKPTLNEFFNSGINVNGYFSKVQANENFAHLKTHSGASDEETLFNEFCNLPVEGFEKGEMVPTKAGIFNGPLNSSTCCHKFDTGDILPGISISTTGIPVLGLYGQQVRNSYSKVIYGETGGQDLVISFTSNEVNSFSLDVLSFPYPNSAASQKVTVKVLDNQGVVVHEETIDASISGTYWAFIGDEQISKVILLSTNNDAWIGIDNIAFGVCTIPDADADDDGCLDDDDSNDISNLETTIKIGSCDSGVTNRMTSTCGITLADDVDKFEAGTYRNNGALVKEFAYLTNLWVSEGLISSEEKGMLMSCAAKAGF